MTETIKDRSMISPWVFAGLDRDRISLSKLRILDVVSEVFEVSKEEMRSKCRLRYIVDARRAFFYLCKKYTDDDLRRIGKGLMNLDWSPNHATVLHGINTAKNLIQVEPEFKKKINKCKLELEGGIELWN